MNTEEKTELDIAGLQNVIIGNMDAKPVPVEDESAELKKNIQRAMGYIMEKRAWNGDENVTRMIDGHMEFLKGNSPDDYEKALKILAAGKKIISIQNKVWKAGLVGDESRLAKLRDELNQLKPTKNEKSRFEKKYQVAKAKHDSEAEAHVVDIPAPDYNPAKGNPHFLKNLRPSRRWTVVMDETGNGFASGDISGREGSDRGKFVAVIIPAESDLKRLSGGDHAMESNEARRAEILTDLYGSRPYCGILGVTLDGMAKVSEYAHVDYWYNLVERTIDIVLRLLPIEGEGTSEISFLLEKRGAFNDKLSNSMAERALHTCLYKLAKADPGRERLIKATMRVEAKNETKNKDFIAYNGYVDAIACVWHSSDRRKATVRSLSEYGLRGTCLLSGNSQNIPELIDAATTNSPLRPDVWADLVVSAKKDGRDSLQHVLLEKFGERVRSDVGLWTEYLEETRRHLDSHAVDLHGLGTRIEWLSSFMPDNACLPPRLELLWLTVKLAHANHCGATEDQMRFVKIDMDRFRGLIRDLYEEDAPLACKATLHLAVQATDSFEFDKARSYLLDFLNAGIEKQAESGFISKIKAIITGGRSANSFPAANPAVTGLRYYSQLLSSLGQCEAFEGNATAAANYFIKAIDGFSRLSEDRDGDIDQTTAYLVTSMMDSAKTPDDMLLSGMEKYLGGSLADVIPVLAASDDSAVKYHHHILLRYLASGRAPKSAVESYLACRDDWAHSVNGHPWELIEFYRGLLVASPAGKRDLFARAFDIAKSGGPTLWVIAAVILNGLIPFDPSKKGLYPVILADIKKALPALGSERIAVLESAVSAPQPPLEFACKVLPFNFR